MPFPSCAPGLECVDSGLISIGGGGSNVCQKPGPPTPPAGTVAGIGERCEGFNEFIGAPFPPCAEGLECVPSGVVSIGGNAENRCLIPGPAFAGEGETCDGFDETTSGPFPPCEEGLICEDTGEIGIPGA